LAVRIIPEPTPEEREALLRVLGDLADERTDVVSPWWQAGVHEAVEDEPEEPA